MESDSSTLYINGTIITVNAKRQIILDGAILVVGNRIAAIGKSSAFKKHPELLPYGTITINLESKIVIPGLVNAHAHVVQSLIRGLGEDLDLYRWTCDTVWAMEAGMKGTDGYVAARLAMAEMLKSGTTCFLEPMLPSQAGFMNVVKAVDETGIRACLSTLVQASEPNTRSSKAYGREKDTDMSVNAAIARHNQYHGSLNDRLHVWLAAETPRGVEEKFYAEVGDACEKHDLRLTIHIAEDTRDSVAIKQCYNASPAQFCKNNKLANSRTVLGHMVHLDLDVDLDILKRSRASVAHSPTANAKLADGIAAVPQMLAKGINVALGTDSAASCNTYDMIREMHVLGFLHKGVAQNTSILPAEMCLEMATINGAKALGLENEIGSLEIGKKADFVVMDTNGLHATPYDVSQLGIGGMHPVTAVVHSCTGNDVEMVVVDGVVVVQDGKLLSVDERQVKRMARAATLSIRNRCGVNAQPLKRGWKYV